MGGSGIIRRKPCASATFSTADAMDWFRTEHGLPQAEARNCPYEFYVFFALYIVIQL
jgi:hypothetical protein